MSFRSKSMLRSNLSEEVLHNIIRIFAEITDSGYAREALTDATMENKLDYAHEMMTISNSVEWRFGSRLSPHVKLRIWREGWKNDERVIQFALDPNIGADLRLGQAEIETIKSWVDTFANAVNQYLVENNLVV